MKRWIIFLLLAALSLSLVACTGGPRSKEAATLDKGFERISIEIKRGRTLVFLTHDTDADYGWSVKGKKKFVKNLNIDVVNGELVIELDDVWGPRISLMQKRSRTPDLELRLNLPRGKYEALKLAVGGALTLESDCEFAAVDGTLEGAAEVLLPAVDRLDLDLDGAATLQVDRCKNASLDIDGAVDLTIPQLAGGLLDCDVDGAASLTLGGEVAAAIVDIDGAAALDGQDLVIGDLDIKMDGVASVTIGRVTGDVTQQVSALSNFEILERD